MMGANRVMIRPCSADTDVIEPLWQELTLESITQNTVNSKNIAMPYTLVDFDYQLPPELIAQYPPVRRIDSRLLHVDRGGHFTDRQFPDVLSLLNPGDLLIFNDTRVIKARLHGTKDSGGKVEMLIERVLSTHEALAHIRASKTPKAGFVLLMAGCLRVTVIERAGSLFKVRFETPVLEALDAHGHVPLPPYIEHTDNETDSQRYQTVYARHPGAVAAPTAGLHFDEALLEQLQSRGVNQAFVTLHVGAGTFQPVRENDLARHTMHSEWYTVPPETVAAVEAARAAGGRVIAVGTTSVRALESSCQAHAGHLASGSDDTVLFITPGYQWRTVDAMITNFHLPQSTLLMLVAAFIGFDVMKAAYQHAIDGQYRFFSYGDAMFLEKGSVDAV